MALATGTKLGSYEIFSQIGAGGMGEVYQAHDTKLGCDVAIKVLPSNFVNDPERLSRFQREARMLAALNHANIATIYGLEQFDGVTCLVMELISGETLAERVKASPLGLEEALKIAGQIAEALEAAHEKGIIHRDLKPANVKVTPEGKVKVLDFGLAKAFAGDPATDDPSNSPTMSAAATRQGVILGTAAYMSPEQARGKRCDKRTDIWAFGCVLYELITGRQAFQGETTTEILASVLKEEPDWRALPEVTPFTVPRLLRRCLQKDANKRCRDAGDVRLDIEEAILAPVSPEPSTTGSAKGIRTLGRGALILGLGILLLVATVTGLTVWNLKPSPLQPVTRTLINLPPSQQLAGLDSGPAVALSPDGTHLAYIARQGGTQQLYLRSMDSLEARPIPGTEGGVNPFFSPDGQWLGFFANAKLKKISVNGGSPLTLGDAVQPGGASWGSQGMIAFAPAAISGLQQVSDAGGSSQPLTRLQNGGTGHRWPDFLPGGGGVVFAAGANNSNWATAEIAAQLVGTAERRKLIQGASQPRYAPSGQLVYAQGGSLLAVPFDPQRLTVTGAAVPVVESVLQFPSSGAAQYSFSATGSLTYVPGGVQANSVALVRLNRKGVEEALPAPAHAYRNPRFSPDGRRVAITMEESGSQTCLYDLARKTLTRVTFQGSINLMGAWTPDGKRVAFQSSRDGAPNLFWQMADGSAGVERLNTSEYAQFPSSWSQDGQLLAFIEINPATGYDIWVLRMGDTPQGSVQVRKAQPFLQPPFNESAPQFSPDGRWLAYVSDESGRFEIYIQPYPSSGGKWQISTEGGTEPVWNPNGRELFYRSGDKMTAMDIATQPNLSAGRPHMLFEGQYVATPGTAPNYDVSRDGQHFLMLKRNEQTQAVTQINVVLNWFEELNQKVPTGKK